MRVVFVVGGCCGLLFVVLLGVGNCCLLLVDWSVLFADGDCVLCVAVRCRSSVDGC